MRIGFKYPPIERGIDINIVTGIFFGVKKIYADGKPAELVDKRRGQYKYYDPNLERDRIIAVVVNFLDYPEFYIDGKKYELFDRIPKFFKVFILLPVIYGMMYVTDIAIFAFLFSVINIFINLAIIKVMHNNILRALLVVLMTAAFGVLSYVVINVFYEFAADWGWVTTSSSTFKHALNYIKLLVK